MQDEFDVALIETGALFCVECGKCTAACPMSEMYPGFSRDLSPRGIVQQALQGRELLKADALWCCTQCRACSRVCPAGVDCCGIVERLRPLAKVLHDGPGVGKCAGCGGDLPPKPVLDFLRSVLPGSDLIYLRLCPACRRRSYARNNC